MSCKNICSVTFISDQFNNIADAFDINYKYDHKTIIK